MVTSRAEAGGHGPLYEPRQGFAAWPLGLTGTLFAAIAVAGGKARSHYHPKVDRVGLSTTNGSTT